MRRATAMLLVARCGHGHFLAIVEESLNQAVVRVSMTGKERR